MIPMGLAMAEPVAIDLPLDRGDEATIPLDDQPSEKAAKCFAHGIAHVVDELGTTDALRWAAQVILGLADAEAETAAH